MDQHTQNAMQIILDEMPNGEQAVDLVELRRRIVVEKQVCHENIFHAAFYELLVAGKVAIPKTQVFWCESWKKE